MRLVSFTVERYRSITKAKKIGLDKSTILVGPNNEGKSNILRALVVAMNILTKATPRLLLLNRKDKGISSHFQAREYYNWEYDYPISLMDSRPNAKTSMTLEFEFTGAEIADFKKEINSKINGTLPLLIEIDKYSIVNIKVSKKGRGATTLSRKSKRIAFFIVRRLNFEHIPAVRTAKAAQEIVEKLVKQELRQLEENEEYIDAVKKITELQKPILDGLSQSIQQTLKLFLPKIKIVEIEINEAKRDEALRSACSITVDDGVPTLLKYKGDGVQSLAALGLMRHAAEKDTHDKNLVIAIEEPESHLHPKAIHDVKSVIKELKDKHQIVITTHNPLFIDRVMINSNIIVNNKKAYPAKTIKEIREILGVRASDNLRHAELVLVVEGEHDKISLSALLSENSTIIRNALSQGSLAFDVLHGSTNLAYKLSLLNEALCNYHCFLDDDKAGHYSFKNAKMQGLLEERDINFSMVPGKVEAEFEDYIDINLYKDMIRNRFGVEISTAKFRTNKKWSERMQYVFKSEGRLWNNEVEKTIKKNISELVKDNPGIALNNKCSAPLSGLVKSLEQRIKEISKGKAE